MRNWDFKKASILRGCTAEIVNSDTMIVVMFNHFMKFCNGRQYFAQKFLTDNKKTFEKDFARYLEESRLFLIQTVKYFPQYIEELRGIADGAKVSFEELFLANNREVVDFDSETIDPGHCTIIGIPKDNGYLVGHNEDWSKEALHELYIADVTIDGVKIFGLNYAHHIIGDSVAINGYGLIQAVNELKHEDEQVGVTKNFFARAILDCKTLEEAEELMQRIPRASGFNHVLVQGTRLWNIESSAKEFVIEKIDGQKYVHTNHYLTELKRIDKGNKESVIRYEKVKQLLSGIHTIDDIKRLLSDRTDPKICRDGTIGSVIFDPMTQTAHIAYGQPRFDRGQPPSDTYVAHSLS